MADALISIDALSEWGLLFESKGAQPPPCLARLEQANQLPGALPGAMQLRNFVDFLEQLAIDTEPQLPWHAGSSTDYTTRGRLGHAILSSKTLGNALRRLTCYFPLLQDATDLSMEVSQGWTTLNYRILDPDIWPRHQDAMYSLGIYASLLKAAAPDAWRETELTVEATQDQASANVAAIVQANCIYGGETNSLRFPTRALDSALQLIPPCDPMIHTELNRQLVRRRRDAPLVDRIRHIIFREMGNGVVSQERVAAELGMTSRTLRRRLVDERTSYQVVLDDCRMRAAALEFRMGKPVSLAEVALKLGYSEHSTFSRAFTRWAGIPPLDYRKRILLH